MIRRMSLNIKKILLLASYQCYCLENHTQMKLNSVSRGRMTDDQNAQKISVDFTDAADRWN